MSEEQTLIKVQLRTSLDLGHALAELIKVLESESYFTIERIKTDKIISFPINKGTE